MKRYFVTGIGTGIGKTLVSAILTEALQADYWKPVQAGNLDDPDSLWVSDFISNPFSVIHPATHNLSEPMSPHAAAAIDGVDIQLSDFKSPETSRDLIVEGAGGLMVPLNHQGDLIIDLIPHVADEVILVSQHYLGSINHTLLSAQVLKDRGIPVKGIIFNGDKNPETESIILQVTGLPCLARIPVAEEEMKSFVKAQAEQIRF